MKGKPETVRPKWAPGFASVLVSEEWVRATKSHQRQDDDSAILHHLVYEPPACVCVYACECTRMCSCCLNDPLVTFSLAS